MNRDWQTITRILHQPFPKKDAHGSLHMPIYENVAFEFESAEDIELAFQRKKPAHAYSRITNPTVEVFEQKIRAVTGAQGVLALSSGMAAIVNVLMAVASAGDNIITSRHLFGNTYSLFSSTLKSWGLQARFADLTRPDEIESLIDEKTRAVFFETITNPQLEVADVEALAAVTKRHGILLLADTTLTPPCAFESKAFGVDIEVLSTTKYISGGGVCVGGVIVDNGTYDWRRNPKLASEYEKVGPFALMSLLRRNVYRNLGACMSPHTAFLQSLGLETLPLRIDVSSENARRIAAFLRDDPRVRAVHYPGIEGSPYYSVAKKQFGRRVGGLLTFDLASRQACFEFINKVALIRKSTNLNDNRTLILHPASTIFCEYDDDLKKKMNVRETMIRLSVGIEAVDDLIDAMTETLTRIH